MDNRAIGVFDSGLGGLTAVKELKRIAPQENIVYFGDTARVPYGSRGPATILKYAWQDACFLTEQNVKYIIVACGTVSSHIDDAFRAHLDVPVCDVIRPAALAAADGTKNGRIGLIATAASIRSGAYERALSAIDPALQVLPKACPLFVPLVEQGMFEKGCEITRLAVEMYLAPLKKQGVDTLILGCTHYPLLAPLIDEYFEGQVLLVDSGRQAVGAAMRDLTACGLTGGNGESAYFVSDDMDSFVRSANLFLGTPVDGTVHEIDIEQFEGVKVWKKRS